MSTGKYEESDGYMTSETDSIEQLEKKVDKHNNFAQRIPVLEEQIKDTNHRLDGLERGV